MNNKTTPKDFFLHLGATIALYIGAVAIINLLFSVINYHFPDSLAGYYMSSMVAWPISILIVVIPILYVLEWLIKRDIRVMPEKNEIWIQKWRIFLTLFLTGAIIAGDLVTLINTYLNGEVSIRFVYKFLVILVILAIIFTYYILEKVGKAIKLKSALAYIGIIITVIAIILGFVVVGSPNRQRSLRFDNQRTNDLQNIQYQIINFWQQKGKLPASLIELKDPLYGTAIPNDPETNASYEYNMKNATTFELCAIFKLETQDIKGRGKYIAYNSYPDISNGNWKHGPGRVCFERVIDQERYPVLKR